MKVCQNCHDFVEAEERAGLEIVEDPDCEMCTEEF